jgi:hypothetical protein
MVPLMVCRPAGQRQQNRSVRIASDKPVFKPPRGEPLWKKETAVLLYTLSMNAIAKQLGVSTPSILNWIRVHAAQHAPRPQPESGENIVVMELDELWHFLQKNPRRPAAHLWPEKPAATDVS